MLIEKNFTVEYAHRLPNHPKYCKYLHGHSGKIRVVFEGKVNIDTGMVRDFGDFKWLEAIIDEFDHALILQATDPLNEVLLIAHEDHKIEANRVVTLAGSPTAENICSVLFEAIFNCLKKLPNLKGTGLIRIQSVSFEETEGNKVTKVK